MERKKKSKGFKQVFLPGAFQAEVSSQARKFVEQFEEVKKNRKRLNLDNLFEGDIRKEDASIIKLWRKWYSLSPDEQIEARALVNLNEKAKQIQANYYQIVKEEEARANGENKQ
jgi:hypothetical protein